MAADLARTPAPQEPGARLAGAMTREPSPAYPIQFTITGRIAHWDAATRQLWIDWRPLAVAAGLEPVAGERVTVGGHRERLSGLWMVTWIR